MPLSKGESIFSRYFFLEKDFSWVCVCGKEWIYSNSKFTPHCPQSTHSNKIKRVSYIYVVWGQRVSQIFFFLSQEGVRSFYTQEANRLKKISRVFHEQREANGVVVVVVVVWIVNIHCRLIHRLVSSSVVENTFFECKMLKNAGVQTRRVYWLPSTPGQRNVKTHNVFLGFGLINVHVSSLLLLTFCCALLVVVFLNGLFLLRWWLGFGLAQDRIRCAHE